MDRLGKYLILIEEEEERITIPHGIWSGDIESGGFYLVGRHLAPSPRSYRFEYLTSVINLVKGMEMKELGENRFLFMFHHIIDRNRAMEGCPWNFDKNILILNVLEDDDIPHAIDQTSVHLSSTFMGYL